MPAKRKTPAPAEEAKKADSPKKAKEAAPTVDHKGAHTAVAGKTVDKVKITRALISVSDKADLIPFAKALAANKVEILSTGGTASAMREAGITVIDVAEYTKFPEVMNGRVKSLHPMIHGGLLAVRGNDTHAKEMKEHGIKNIDLVVVNLYPFQDVVAKGCDFDTAVENVDIGGPSMTRSAAKNNAAVCVVTSTKQYKEVMAEMAAHKGCTTLALRRRMAAAAFTLTAEYDTAISTYFNKQKF